MNLRPPFRIPASLASQPPPSPAQRDEIMMNLSRVSDTYSFDTDPDPAFWAEFRCGSRDFLRSKMENIYS